LTMLDNPLTRPTIKRPVYTDDVILNPGTINRQQRIELFPRNLSATSGSNLTVEYWKKPLKPEWAYVVIGQKALYNTNNSKNFTLHPIEEEPLVIKVLELAGITIKREDLQQAAMAQAQITKQNQNS